MNKEKSHSINTGTAVIIALAVIVFISVLFIFFTNVNIRTTHIKVENEKIPPDFSGFRIAHISDLHNHDWGTKLTDRIIKEKPDIIAITGDFIDASHTSVDTSMEVIEKIKNTAPIYYVTGNHEANIGRSEYKYLISELKKAGVHIITEKKEWITRGNSKINIIGLSDPNFDERNYVSGMKETIITTKLMPLMENDYYNIVLSHRPEVFETYVGAKADLVLSGHAHGGQIRLPFIGGLYAPGQGFFPEYTKGLYHKENTDMIVSRGLGNSVCPIRINNTPELLIITLN